MRLKPVTMLIPAVLFMAAALPLSAQSAYSAKRGAWPVAIGAGYSSINTDWGQDAHGNPRIVNGVTVWFDWKKLPFLPHGFGLEAEGEHVNWNQPAALPQLRIDAVMGGPTYTYTVRDFRRLRFYGKGMIGFGGINFPPFGNYSHDTRTIWAPGLGAEYRAWNSFWVRADYEYQYWPNLFSRGHTLNPHGLTIGMVYDFSTMHRNY